MRKQNCARHQRMTTTMSSFIRPIGVHRDINELEFISSLLQSHQHVVRASGSIKAVDIAVYLKSRHGIIISEETIDQYIITELAGQIQNDMSSSRDNKDLKVDKPSNGKKAKAIEDNLRIPLDVCQLMAILLIPELLEKAESMDFKLFTPFRDVVTKSMTDGRITVHSLREIFESVNEVNVSDEVIEEMLQLANCPEGLIDALVSDLALYKGHDDISNTPKLVKALSNPNTPETSLSMESKVIARSVYTAPFIDYGSDTFRRPLFGMQLWTAGIAAYFAYVLNVKGSWVSTRCDSDSTGCNIAKGITTWISIFLQIVTLGLPYILLGSIGNANIAKIYRLPAILISMSTVFAVTILTYSSRISTNAFTTTGNKDLNRDNFCDDDDFDCMEICRVQPESCKEDYIVANDYYGASYFLALILGCTILISQFVDVVLMFLPQRWLDGNGLAQRIALPGTERQERAGKQAASFRMKQFLKNALDIVHDKTILSSSTSSDGATKKERATSVLERFLLLPVKTESVGGVIWAWRRIWNGTIFTQEGIWLNGRLLACNFSQLTIFGIMIFFTRVFFYKQKDFFYSDTEQNYRAYVEKATEILYGNYTDVLGDDYYNFLNCSQTILEVDLIAEGGNAIDYTEPWNFIAYISVSYLSYEEAKIALQPCFDEYPSVAAFFDDSNNALSYQSDTLKDLVSDFDITSDKYVAAAICGLVGGFITVFYIAAILIPSFVTTVMKYRSGVKPTLTNPEFLRFRYAIDTVTVLLGSAFWGCFFTATGAMAFVIGLILFIGLIPFIIGSVVGFFIILSIRLSILLLLRSAFFSALYRKKPGAANAMLTVLEVWNIALTLGFVFIRSIKLILVSILYIARIDTPFLATGVGRFGPIELDSVSIAFEKDLLFHEAHRHMFIERFGLLCLLKLYAGDKFATRAGSAWRLLFVLITMPWLRKYRVDRNTISLEEQIEHVQDEMEEEADVWSRNEQMIKLKELQSEKAILYADKNSADELSALRQRNEYLEEKIKQLEQRSLGTPVDATEGADAKTSVQLEF